MSELENGCLRCRNDCTPAANLQADDKASFICVGWNRVEGRPIAQDRFTLCWKNEQIDERGYWDKRDLIDTMSVIAQALSADENMRVNMKVEESDMQEIDFLS